MSHRLLERQLQRLGLARDAAPSVAAWNTLLDRVAHTYREDDEARSLLERSTTLASDEMFELNRRLRAAEAERASERDRLHAIFVSLADAVCVLAADATCQLLNPAGATLLRIAAETARGRPLAALVGGLELVSADLAAGRRFDDVRLRRADGTTFPAAVVLTPIDGGAGAVLVIRDATESRRVELELRRAQRLEAVGRLAAGIAHEINTPVQFASDSVVFLREGFEDLARFVASHRALRRALQSGGRADAELQDAAVLDQALDLDYTLARAPAALDRCLDGLARVATIVRSMREFARPESKEKVPVDLNGVVSSALSIARHEFKPVADVETALGELPPVLCHSGDVNEIVLNLVVNAAHAIQSAVAAGATRGRITVTTRRDGGDAVIEVADTGCGIPESVRDHVFDPFFTTKEAGKGVGQSLAVARSIVEQRHGGSLRFTTETGRGTTFVLRLPIDGAAKPAPPTSAAADAPVAGAHR